MTLSITSILMDDECIGTLHKATWLKQCGVVTFRVNPRCQVDKASMTSGCEGSWFKAHKSGILLSRTHLAHFSTIARRL
jgi:hypothetical protein